MSTQKQSRKRKPEDQDESLLEKNASGENLESKIEKKKKKKKKDKKALAAENADSISSNAINQDVEMKAEVTSENDEVVEKEDVQKKSGKKRKRKSSEVEEESKDLENDDPKKQQEFKNRTEKLISSVLDYLHQWKNDVKSWKFSKYHQSCLIHYLDDPAIINEEDFETCLLYLKKCRGKSLKKLKMKSKSVIEEHEKPDAEEKGQKKKKAKSGLQSSNAKARENDDCVLFVKNLPYGLTKEEIQKGLKDIFKGVVEVRMPYKEKMKYIGFAFVEFSDPSDVTLALSAKKGAKLGGRPLRLDRIGSKNKSTLKGSDDVRMSLKPEFVKEEQLRRAKRVVQMFG